MQSVEISKIFEKVHIDEPTIDIMDQSPMEGMATITPLLRGYGTTIGNSLRRVLLSSLPGAAVVSIMISGNGTQLMRN